MNSKKLKGWGEKKMRADIPFRLKCLSDPASYAAIEEDYTGGLVTEVFDDSDEVGTDVLLHGCP